jgi:hypothetical protein
MTEMSIRPRSPRVWWTLIGVFALLGAIFALAFWGLTRQTHRRAGDACVESGGTWDPTRGVCAHNR